MATKRSGPEVQEKDVSQKKKTKAEEKKAGQMKKLTSANVIKTLHCNQNKCLKVRANRTTNKAEMLDENIGRFAPGFRDIKPCYQDLMLRFSCNDPNQWYYLNGMRTCGPSVMILFQ